MPRLNVNDLELYYEDTGPPKDLNNHKRPVVFVHGLLWDHSEWDTQVEFLRQHHRCITFDLRGHARSEVPDDPFIDLETQYLDVAVLIRDLDAGPCHLVGISMGGAIALRVAARRPELVDTLTIIGSSAGRENPDKQSRYTMLNLVARMLGVRPLIGQIMPLMFSDRFLEDPQRESERERWRAVLADNDSSIHKAVNGFIHRPSIVDELHRIRAATQIIHGTKDQAVDLDEGRRIAEAIDGAEFHPVPDTGHMVPLEEPDDFNDLMDRFLQNHETPAHPGVGPGEFAAHRHDHRPSA